MPDRNPSFLYVEDDMNSRLVIKILIQTVMKYPDLTIFEDSHDFQDKLNRLPHIPDVIFLDIQIAPLNGYEMLKILRDDVRYQNATIIAMTANVMSHDVAKLKAVGFDGLIGKPIDKAQVPQLINRILDGENIWFVP